MAKRIIISSAPPKPSKRVIGGSTQRSSLRSSLQGSYAWKHNHAPEDLDESKNLNWWSESANRYDIPLSSSADLLYTRQASQRELLRETDKRKLYNFSIDLEKAIKGGSNQPFNKKHRLVDMSFGSIETELNITDEIYPNTKKRISLKAEKDGVDYVAEQILPFSIFSSSVNTGYQSELSSSGFVGLDFTNYHDDKIQTYRGEVPAQGPFTERFVGGIQARHVAPLKTSERKESFNLVLTPNAKATSTLSVNVGVVPADLEDETLVITLGGVLYSAIFDDGVNIASSTKTTIGTADAIDADDTATAILTSLNDSISSDSLPVTAAIVLGASNSILLIVNEFGASYNGASWSGTVIDPTQVEGSDFSGGSLLNGSLTRHSTGDTPKGHYLRGTGAKSGGRGGCAST